jgi:putative transposase
MAEKKIAIKTFEYKLRMNRKFQLACERELEHSRQIYNAALAERIDCYKTTGKGLNYIEQSRHLTEARTLPEVKSHIRSIQQDALERVDAAYQAFFKRVKESAVKPGFPRFKGFHRYHTFSLKLESVRACPLKGDKLTIPGVGSCRVRLSRRFEGKAKQIRITRRADGWYVLIVSEIPRPPTLPSTGESAGIDVGIKCFATLSTGEEIDNPRCLKNAEKKLKKQQRRLSRKKRDSRNRAKARKKVALAHLKVTRTRKDFHHKTSTYLVRRFDAIAVESLNIKGLLKNPKLAKAIADVGWSAFFTMIEVKAGNAGRRFEKVPARFTSQDCSHCGNRQKMPLAVRVYQCPSCGKVLDRDHNAAINIRSRAGQARINVCGESPGSEKQERHRLNKPKAL